MSFTHSDDFFKGQYHRLDRYQEDVFAVLEKAREISRSDSEVSNYNYCSYDRVELNNPMCILLMTLCHNFTILTDSCQGLQYQQATIM